MSGTKQDESIQKLEINFSKMLKKKKKKKKKKITTADIGCPLDVVHVTGVHATPSGLQHINNMDQVDPRIYEFLYMAGFNEDLLKDSSKREKILEFVEENKVIYEMNEFKQTIKRKLSQTSTIAPPSVLVISQSTSLPQTTSPPTTPPMPPSKSMPTSPQVIDGADQPYCTAKKKHKSDKSRNLKLNEQWKNITCLCLDLENPALKSPQLVFNPSPPPLLHDSPLAFNVNLPLTTTHPTTSEEQSGSQSTISDPSSESLTSENQLLSSQSTPTPSETVPPLAEVIEQTRSSQLIPLPLFKTTIHLFPVMPITSFQLIESTIPVTPILGTFQPSLHTDDSTKGFESTTNSQFGSSKPTLPPPPPPPPPQSFHTKTEFKPETQTRASINHPKLKEIKSQIPDYDALMTEIRKRGGFLRAGLVRRDATDQKTGNQHSSDDDMMSVMKHALLVIQNANKMSFSDGESEPDLDSSDYWSD